VGDRRRLHRPLQALSHSQRTRQGLGERRQAGPSAPPPTETVRQRPAVSRGTALHPIGWSALFFVRSPLVLAVGVGLFVESHRRRLKRTPAWADAAYRKTSVVQGANPSRGGDAKPGISSRPPGRRLERFTSRSSRLRQGGPEVSYILLPKRARISDAAPFAPLGPAGQAAAGPCGPVRRGGGRVP
jgi:hypothetical protein